MPQPQCPHSSTASNTVSSSVGDCGQERRARRGELAAALLNGVPAAAGPCHSGSAGGSFPKQRHRSASRSGTGHPRCAVQPRGIPTPCRLPSLQGEGLKLMPMFFCPLQKCRTPAHPSRVLRASVPYLSFMPACIERARPHVRMHAGIIYSLAAGCGSCRSLSCGFVFGNVPGISAVACPPCPGTP